MPIKLPSLPLQLFRTTVLRVLPIVFAVIFGLTALVMTKRLIATERQQLAQEREKLYADYKDPLEVFVAVKDIAAGDVIEGSHLGLIRVPEKFLQPYVVRAPQEVLGMVAIAPIAEGEQLLSNKFRRKEDAPHDATLADMTPKGRRAITIAVDTLSGVGGFIRPGDNIDILWTIQLPAGDGQQVVTLTLFQDVPVLAIAGGATPGEGGGGGGFTVTLALEPQQTSFLLFAREQGRIQLSLRSRNESGAVAVAPANINTLMESVLGPQEVPPPVRAPHQVEVYKGLTRDVVVIADEASDSR
jgi:pilus assembly protein CpaB